MAVPENQGSQCSTNSPEAMMSQGVFRSHSADGHLTITVYSADGRFHSTPDLKQQCQHQCEAEDSKQTVAKIKCLKSNQSLLALTSQPACGAAL